MADLLDAKHEIYGLMCEWTEAVAESKKWSEKEMDLRKRIFSIGFPAPKEGVNAVPLLGNWTLKGTYKINRKIDGDALPAIVPKLRELIAGRVDKVFTWTPSLGVKEYKSLVEMAQPNGDGVLADPKITDAVALIHSVVTASPGSPTLEVVPPKAPK